MDHHVASGPIMGVGSGHLLGRSTALNEGPTASTSHVCPINIMSSVASFRGFNITDLVSQTMW